MSIDKTIQGLQHCFNAKCEGCPYGDTASGHYVCRRHEMLGDALELLKEKEAVKPERESSGVTWWNVCGACRTAINPNDKYCHECGQAVKWE